MLLYVAWRGVANADGDGAAAGAALPLTAAAQVMLTCEPALVDASAALLLTVLQHHSDALQRLYTTVGGWVRWWGAEAGLATEVQALSNIAEYGCGPTAELELSTASVAVGPAPLSVTVHEGRFSINGLTALAASLVL